MPTISPELEKILRNMDGNDSFTEEMKSNLRISLTSSPALTERMNQAAESGLLKQFALIPSDNTSGGYYDPSEQRIGLRPQDLQGDFTGLRKLGNMVYMLGHEIQHGFNSAERKVDEQAAKDTITAIARDPDPYNDFTAAGELWKQASLKDEGKAGIAGWNATADMLRHRGETATPDRMFDAIGPRVLDAVEFDSGQRTLRPRDDVDLTAGGFLADSPGNIALIGGKYYNNPQHTVGIAGSTYPNYDGAAFFGFAGAQHLKLAKPHEGKEPVFVVDMKRLDMQESPIEINGVDFRSEARRHPKLQYFDSSDGALKERYMSHTIETHKAVTPASGGPEIGSTAAPRRREGFDNPQHPEHALYNEIRQRLPPETSPDRLSQITLAASRGGIQSGEVARIDVQDTKLYLQGAIPGDKAVVDLTSPPPTQQDTLRQFDTFEQQRVQQMQQFQEMERQVPQQGGSSHTR